jgi:YHS domain-containing protein
MNDLSELDRRIKEKLAVDEERWKLQQNHLQQRMREFEQRHQRYTALADSLIETVIRPRMAKLASYFDNAKLLDPDQTGRHQCLCCFGHTTRFPATTKLELAISRDGDYQNLFMLYNLEILPVFFPFEGRDQLTLPLDKVNEEQAAAWVDEKIVRFVDTYLRLETTDHYQTENLVTDPVCGMQINKVYAAAQMSYQGKTYYFCLEECQRKFARDPERYFTKAVPTPDTEH